MKVSCCAPLRSRSCRRIRSKFYIFHIFLFLGRSHIDELAQTRYAEQDKNFEGGPCKMDEKKCDHQRCPDTGYPQDASSWAAAHVCHVWSHHSGADSGKHLFQRRRTLDSGNFDLRRTWNFIFPSLLKAESTCFSGFFFCISGRFRHRCQPGYRHLC